jgi:DNA-binding IclR family transcriptional regulator
LLLFIERPRVRLTDAAAYLGVASSTAHRLLSVLHYRGFVTQEEGTRAYSPGSALAIIASAAARQLDVRARARPVLERLNAQLLETISLAQLQGTSIHFVDSIEGSRAVRVGQRTGVTMPAHCTASGKAALSQLSDETLMSIYPEETLATVTGRSIVSRAQLLRDLSTTRKRGYATTIEESEEGVSGVAVAIQVAGGAQYTLSAAVPVHRATAGTRRSIAKVLTEAANELRSRLG